MADLRSKFIEDYAGGLLNVSRQELASTGEVLSQDGFLSNATLFVEDGSGTKSGLLLGASLCEVVDPTTTQSAVNVRYADRTYASIRDLKIFSTAIASAQAALSDASSSSITNLENAFELLEDAFNTLQNNFNTRESVVDEKIESLSKIQTIENDIDSLSAEQKTLSNSVVTLEASTKANSASFEAIGNIKKASFTAYGKVTAISPTVATGESNSNRTAGSYSLTNLVSSTGTDLDVNVTVASDGAVTVSSIVDAGSDFLVGDEITIPDSSLGSGGAPSVVLQVTEISLSMSSDKLAPQVQALTEKVNEIITTFANF